MPAARRRRTFKRPLSSIHVRSFPPHSSSRRAAARARKRRSDGAPRAAARQGAPGSGAGAGAAYRSRIARGDGAMESGAVPAAARGSFTTSAHLPPSPFAPTPSRQAALAGFPNFFKKDECAGARLMHLNVRVCEGRDNIPDQIGDQSGIHIERNPVETATPLGFFDYFDC